MIDTAFGLYLLLVGFGVGFFCGVMCLYRKYDMPATPSLDTEQRQAVHEAERIIQEW